MSCDNPLRGYRPTNGGPVFFKRPQQWTYAEIEIPCGQCMGCRLEQTRQWAVRITHEAQRHDHNCFVTLTLNDEHMDELGSLQYERHVQPFYKRLRERLKPTRISHFTVGEYGERTMRPHYHACIFGADFRQGSRIVRRGENQLWTHPVLEKAWGQGHVSVGVLNFKTASYTAGYITKKLSGQDGYVHLDDATGEITWLEQPAARMSLRPAIGRTWIEEHGNYVYAHDHVVIDGRPQKPPKYYDRWLKGRSEIAEEMIKKERQKGVVKLTEQQRRARARNAHARARQKNKKL